MKQSLFFSLAASLVCSTASADAIDDLPAGSWYEIPDSHLEDVFPSTSPGADPGGVLYGFSGATLDSARERLLLWGGGHGDYAGNEVYAFSLRTLRWERLNDPSVADATNAETYGDGRPVSRHTYSGLVYVPGLDVMEARGGSRWQNGNGTSATWRLHLGDLTWERMADIPDWDFFGDVSLYDPVTGHVFTRHNRGVYEYVPETDTYTELHAFDAGLWQTNSSGAIDPESRTILYVGTTVDLFHIDTGVYEADVTFTGQDAAVEEAPGLAYDPSLHRFVSWHGGDTVYSLDREAGRWEAHRGAGTSPGPRPTDRDSGAGHLTYGRFRYVPSRNVYVLVNYFDHNVFVYRMAEGPGVPVEPLPDAGPGRDGGAAPDGGTSARDAALVDSIDGSLANDAGPGTALSGSCACRAGRAHPPSGLLFLALGALMASRRGTKRFARGALRRRHTRC